MNQNISFDLSFVNPTIESMRAQHVAILGVLFFLGCSTTSRPCSQYGDTAWNGIPAPDGDMTCKQSKQADGSMLNDGSFKRFWKNGKLGLQGQFRKGKKHGIWFVFDETGKKVQEKFFRDGIETSLTMTDEQLKEFMKGQSSH